MSNENLRKAEIKKAKDTCCNVSATVCVIGIVGIAISTSILSMVAIAVITGGISYAGLKKIKKFNEEEKTL